MRPHGPSPSLELWDALKESGTAPFGAGISPEGISQLCSLAFYFIFPLSSFFFPPCCVGMCCALEMEEQRERLGAAVPVVQRGGRRISLVVFSWGLGSRPESGVPWCEGADVQFSELRGLQHFPRWRE